MSIRHYSYSVTITPTGTPDTDAPLREPFSFEATNHDDILAIVERAGSKLGLKPHDAASMIVGLKLFGEVMLREKANPLFDPLRSGMKDFMAGLKARVRQE